jgi:hypothetical protein
VWWLAWAAVERQDRQRASPSHGRANYAGRRRSSEITHRGWQGGKWQGITRTANERVFTAPRSFGLPCYRAIDAPCCDRWRRVAQPAIAEIFIKRAMLPTVSVRQPDWGTTTRGTDRGATPSHRRPSLSLDSRLAYACRQRVALLRM